MNGDPIRIATRTSRLALWQAQYVADRLGDVAPQRDVVLVHVSTEGDRDQTEPLHLIGSLGVFTREVQRAVLDGRADIAVHSLKDLPTEPVAGLILAAVPKRASMFDALVLPRSSISTTGSAIVEDAGSALSALPPNAPVATGSIRRRAQLLHARTDLEMCDVRGNVETRIRKLDDGEFDALILAEAALQRLGLDERISRTLSPPLLYPAVSQGALGIECRDTDSAITEMLANLTDESTHAAVLAERALLAELRAGCHAPLGVLSSVNSTTQTLEAVVLSPTGDERIVARLDGAAGDPTSLGRNVAALLKADGAERLIEDAAE